MWSTSAEHQGKPLAQLWPPASSLKSLPMAGTTALGWAGREAQLAEVWKAEGSHLEGCASGQVGGLPGGRERCKCGEGVDSSGLSIG